MFDELSQYCTFFVNDILFGIEVGKIQEVIKYQHMTRVPTANQEIAGLLNLRGQIVIVIDFRSRLHMPPRTHEKNPVNIIINTESGGVSLLVDQIGDVLALDESCREEPPRTLKTVEREFVKWVYKLDKSLMLVPDVHKMISTHLMFA